MNTKRPASLELEPEPEPEPARKTLKVTASSSKPAAAPAAASFFTLRKAGQVFPALKPNPLSYAEKKDARNVKISCWNVRSARDCNSEKKGRALRKYVEAEDPDILILTEVKWPDAEKSDELEWIRPRFAHRTFTGYTAVLSKFKPVKVTKGLPEWQTSEAKETESRCITLEFANTFLIGCYVQNSGENRKFMSKRIAWNNDFARYVRDLQVRKSVIFGGDWNVALSKVDVERPEKNWNVSPGAHPPERDAHAALLAGCDLVDVWRGLHPDRREFTHTSAKWGGWRIDGLIVSRAVAERAVASEIRHDVFRHFPNASDHWSIMTEIRGPL